MNNLANCYLNLKPRIYQKQARSLMLKNFKEKNDHTFHIVAPPGSGKTILGISLLLELKNKTLILSPNLIIAKQWIDKFKNNVESFSENLDISKLIGAKLDEKKDVISITYQAISVKDKNGKLHENAKKFIDFLIENEFKTIILDECHHLLSYWAEIIKKIIKKAPYKIVLIGLTATLPKDQSSTKKKNYIDLLEEVDYQVPIPAVVKDNNLSPFRDLLYITKPSDSEEAFLRESYNNLDKLIIHSQELSKKSIVDYDFYQYIDIFIQDTEYEDEKIAFNELQFKDQQLFISIIKFIISKNLEPPIEIVIQNELLEDMSIYDYAVLFKLYYNYLNKQKQNLELLNFKKEIVKIFYDFGYKIKSKNLVQIKSNISYFLDNSKSKIKAVENILRLELEGIGEELKSLVITDFIEIHNKNFKNLDLKGGAVGVFIHLSKTNIYDELTPVMLSGKKILIHKSLEKYFDDLEFEDKNNYLLAKKIKNTSSQIIKTNKLMYDNKIKLIIGTKSLLGEGYDNVEINTLVDLTNVSSYVSTNQIRGRALRKDVNRFDKVSNIWEIMNSAKLGDSIYDFSRVEKKHDNFLSLSPKGNIEKGIGHLGLKDINNTDIDLINEQSFKLAKNRGDTFTAWKIGEKYNNKIIEKIDFKDISKSKSKKYENRKNIVSEDFNYQTQGIVHKKRKRRSYLFIILTLAIIFYFLFNIREFFLLSLPLIFFAGINIYKMINQKNKKNFLMALSKTIFFSLKELNVLSEKEEYNKNIEIYEDEENTSILINNYEISSMFSDMMKEVFDNISNQKYIIEYMVNKNRNYFPLPKFFSKNRNYANVYKRYWNKYISNGDLIYIKNKSNLNIVKNSLNKQSKNTNIAIKHIWQ